MSLRDLIVVLDDSPRNAAQLDFAAGLARQHDAHLTGLFLLELLVPALPGYALGSYPDVFAVQPSLDLSARAYEKAGAIETAFRDVLRRDGLKGDWVLGKGLAAEAAVRRAHSTDLLVVGQYNAEAKSNPSMGDLIGDLLMDSGRPLLILPYAGKFEAVGKNVLVAWNDSAQSTRAVHDALPLIAPDAKVTVLSVQRPRRAEDEALPGAEIAEHLARHGFAVSAARTVSDGSLSDADALLGYASDNGADLLVMGGYGHSRRREIVFGGVTRSLLDHMTLPVLMSH